MSKSTRNHRKFAMIAGLVASAAVPGQTWAQTIVGTAIDSSATRALNGVEVELVESITIKKSLTPDMDADTLGGSVEIETATAFSRTNAYVGVTFDYCDPQIPAYAIDFGEAGFLNASSYRMTLIDPVPGGGELRDFTDTNGFANFSRNDLESTFVSAAENFRTKEDVYARYLLGRYITSGLRVIAGVRMERTENVFFGNRLDINEDAETLTITPVNLDRSYTDWLPNINVRFEPADDVVLRAAAFKPEADFPGVEAAVRDFHDDGVDWILDQIRAAPNPVFLVVHAAQVGVYQENAEKGVENERFAEVIAQPNLAAVISGDLHMDMDRTVHIQTYETGDPQPLERHDYSFSIAAVRNRSEASPVAA